MVVPSKVRNGQGRFCSLPCRPHKISGPDALWARGIRTESGCLVWAGALNNMGYGQISYQRKKWLVHRLAWTLKSGVIPAGLFICHHCDTPPCFDPSHLFLGTRRENGLDMVSKGRGSTQRHPHLVRRGEDQPRAILTTEQVREIRQRYIPKKVTLKMLAEEYGVHLGTIWAAINRNWKHCD